MLRELCRTLRGSALLFGVFCGPALAQATAAPAAAPPAASARQSFYVRLTLPRPTFSQDMSADERNLMGRHVVYWTALFNAGKFCSSGR